MSPSGTGNTLILLRCSCRDSRRRMPALNARLRRRPSRLSAAIAADKSRCATRALRLLARQDESPSVLAQNHAVAGDLSTRGPSWSVSPSRYLRLLTKTNRSCGLAEYTCRSMCISGTPPCSATSSIVGRFGSGRRPCRRPGRRLVDHRARPRAVLGHRRRSGGYGCAALGEHRVRGHRPATRSRPRADCACRRPARSHRLVAASAATPGRLACERR